MTIGTADILFVPEESQAPENRELMDSLRTGSVRAEQLSAEEHMTVFGFTHADLADLRRQIIATMRSDIERAVLLKDRRAA